MQFTCTHIQLPFSFPSKVPLLGLFLSLMIVQQIFETVFDLLKMVFFHAYFSLIVPSMSPSHRFSVINVHSILFFRNIRSPFVLSTYGLRNIPLLFVNHPVSKSFFSSDDRCRGERQSSLLENIYENSVQKN